MSQHVAHLQWHGFIGFSLHPGLLAGPVPVPVKRLPHVSFSVLNGLIPIPYPGVNGVGGLGSLTSNAVGREVSSWGLPMVGRTNDAGFIVPHVSIPPTNWILPLTILFGGSDSFMGSSQVRIPCYKGLLQMLGGGGSTEEFDTAACVFPQVPISLNFGCFEPILAPLDVTIAPNNTLVGLTWKDLLNCAIDFALAAAVELLMAGGGAAVGKAGKKAKKKLAKKSAETSMKKATRAAAEAKAKVARKTAKRKAKKAARTGVDPDLRSALRRRRAKVRGKPFKKRPSADVRAGDKAFKKSIRKEFGDPAAARRKMLEQHKAVMDHVQGKPAWLRKQVETGFWRKALGDRGAGSVAGEVADNRLRPFLKRGTKEAFKSITKKWSGEEAQGGAEQARGDRDAPAGTADETPEQAAARSTEVQEGERILASLGV
jgi:hypothetical protein